MNNVYFVGQRVKECQWSSILKKYEKQFDKIEILNLSLLNESFIKKLCGKKIIVIGSFWETDYKQLKDKWGLELWTDIVPEWAIDICWNNKIDYYKLLSFFGEDYKKFEDSFYYIQEYKKIAGVWGNCHSLFLNDILNQTDYIRKNYVILYFPFIHEIGTYEKENGLPPKIIGLMSLFIYQLTSAENKVSPMFETEKYILPFLNDKCLRCSIPFTYFEGYFPQYKKNLRDRNNMSPYGDKFIEECIYNGLSENEIIQKGNSDQLFSKKYLDTFVEKSFAELEKRECQCDVKISDYVRANYKKEKLFYTPSHPKTKVLVELMKRVYSYIGLRDLSINDKYLRENKGWECYIYKSVFKNLELSFSQDLFLFNGRIKNQKSDLIDYAKIYKNINFPELGDEDQITVVDKGIININESSFSSRIYSNIFIKKHVVYLYLVLDVCDEGNNVGTIKKAYVPARDIIVNATTLSGKIVPIQITNSGEVKVFRMHDLVLKNEVMLINSSYPMK